MNMFLHAPDSRRTVVDDGPPGKPQPANPAAADGGSGDC